MVAVVVLVVGVAVVALVKDARALLLYLTRPILEVTWTGDTHRETDVLPSN